MNANLEEDPTAEPLSDEQRALATVCAHFIGVFAIAFALVRWSAIQAGLPAGFGFFEKVALMTLAVAMMTGTSARSGLISSAQALALGPWVLVGGAIAINVIELSVPLPDAAALARVSWVCIWIIGFPLVGPRLPAATPLLAATMGLIVLAIAVGTETLSVPSPDQVVVAFAPQFIAAAAIALPMERLLTQRTDDRLGSYRLVRRLGVGGMGEVWTAEHRLLAFPAAIKLIRYEAMKTVGGAEAREVELRFQREAQATSTLQSPHTVRLFDYGIADDRRLFYVMELLHGLDLSTYVKRFGPLHPDRAIWILRQACLSLAEAHSQGLVHRDIKPSNLFVCRLGFQVDYVKVLDFGLVSEPRLVNRTALVTASDSSVSMVGTVVGTPAYISPEACLGREVDHRSDLYALGCVAVWLLTGRLLFEGSLADTLHQHAHAPPLLRTEHAERTIPDDLERVVLSCLAKDPGARPQTAIELYELLGACDTGEWSNAKSRAWWDTHLPALELA